jgi:hypothetical protein
VKTQVQNLVLSLFTWSEGKYLFEPGALPTQEAITLDWDTPGAVLQGLRGLPLNYIRPLAPPRDSIIERAPETGILAELQLNSAEQKLLALLVGRHPMEQLLALDFIANESLLRGLVTFAALGLIAVHPGAARAEIPEDDGAGDTIDPLDQRPPAFLKPPQVEDLADQVAWKGVRPDNSWPDPEPVTDSEPGHGWTAPAAERRQFVPGPALAAFEAEHSFPPPQEAVPRAVYEALLLEKQGLQQKLFALLEERNKSQKDVVPRELFDQVQAEKRQLQEKMMLTLDELLRLRQQPASPEEERGPNVRSFPGTRKNE